MSKKINQKQMYWIFQLTGWTTFALSNLGFTYLNNQQITISDITYCFFIFVLGIVQSNLIRKVFKHFKWLSQNITVILHKLAFLALIVGVLNIGVLYFLSTFCKNSIHGEIDWVNFITLSEISLS